MAGYGKTAFSKKKRSEMKVEGGEGPTTRIVNSSDLFRFGVMNASFYVSDAFGDIQDLSSKEIVEKAETLLSEAPEMVVSKALEILKSTQMEFSSKFIETKRALSGTSYKDLVSSLENRTMPEDAKQPLVLATAVYGVVGLFGKSDHFKMTAEKMRDKLLSQLEEVEKFLSSIEGSDNKITSAMENNQELENEVATPKR